LLESDLSFLYYVLEIARNHALSFFEFIGSLKGSFFLS